MQVKKKLKNKNKKQIPSGASDGFLAHTHDTSSVRPTHFALRPGGLRGERGRGGGVFGFTEEAVLLASERQRGALLTLGTLPGTQRIPGERLPVRYRNDRNINRRSWPRLALRTSSTTSATVKESRLHAMHH